MFISPIGRPRVLEFRDGFLYLTSETLHAVRKYDAGTGALIGNFIDTASGGLNVPIGLAFGPDGFCYVSSAGTNSILKYHATTGAFVSTFAGPAEGVNLPAFITIVPSPPANCPGDADNDSAVDFDDITAVIANWGATTLPGSGSIGDANDDGVVNFDDINQTLANWGSACA